MIFLGGTCNGSDWRDRLIPLVKRDCFNPVVDDWNEEAYQRELAIRETADTVVYVLTPKMAGVYSIAEVVDDSNKQPEKTVLCILEHDDGRSFSKGQMKSLNAVGKMVARNGGRWVQTLDYPNDLHWLAMHLNGETCMYYNGR